MTRITLTLALSFMSVAAFAQKAIDVIPVSDIFDIATHRFITIANEEDDVAEVTKYYTDICTSYGYTHELTGEGFGGPCTIIDGFHKGGYNDKENYLFIPTDRAGASTIFISACNDDIDKDYGYLYVRLTIFSEGVLNDIYDQMQLAGFNQFVIDNPDEVENCQLFYI